MRADDPNNPKQIFPSSNIRKYLGIGRFGLGFWCGEFSAASAGIVGTPGYRAFNLCLNCIRHRAF